MVETKKITIEVPEGVDEKLFIRLLTRESARVVKLIKEWERNVKERGLTKEEEDLLKEIKKAVARRAEEG